MKQRQADTAPGKEDQPVGVDWKTRAQDVLRYVRRGWLKHLRYALAAADTSVDQRDRTTGETPLMAATRLDDNLAVIVSRLLLQYDADVDLTDRNGRTALILACRRAKVKTALLLLTEEADSGKSASPRKHTGLRCFIEGGLTVFRP